jgi:hypothetical protein
MTTVDKLVMPPRNHDEQTIETIASACWPNADAATMVRWDQQLKRR